MKKTLYLEGAGCVPCGEVANCRIRTAFTNKDGEKIYIEITGREAAFNAFVGHCTDCYIISDNSISRLQCENKIFKYTYNGILNFINENCNADFDKINVLDDLAGYRVFAGVKGSETLYNFGDTFAYDESLTKRRRAKVEELKAHFKQIFDQKYDNTSYYIEDNALTVCINVTDKKRIEAGYPDRKFTIAV